MKVCFESPISQECSEKMDCGEYSPMEFVLMTPPSSPRKRLFGIKFPSQPAVTRRDSAILGAMTTVSTARPPWHSPPVVLLDHRVEKSLETPLPFRSCSAPIPTLKPITNTERVQYANTDDCGPIPSLTQVVATTNPTTIPPNRNKDKRPFWSTLNDQDQKNEEKENKESEMPETCFSSYCTPPPPPRRKRARLCLKKRNYNLDKAWNLQSIISRTVS